MEVSEISSVKEAISGNMVFKRKLDDHSYVCRYMGRLIAKGTSRKTVSTTTRRFHQIFRPRSCFF